MVVILEAHLAVGVGRDILSRHKSLMEKTSKPLLHTRAFKRKTNRSASAYSFMKQLDAESFAKEAPYERQKMHNSTNSGTRTWHSLLANHITLTEVKNDPQRSINNRNADKTIQLWKHKLVYYKSGVVFSDGEIDLREVVKIQMQRATKIALILEIEEPKAKQERKNLGSNEKQTESEKRKDLVRRAWVVDFGDNTRVAKEWLSGFSTNWKLAQQVLAVKISPNDLEFPKSILARMLMKITRTGDIILFKSKHPSGLIIRSWSGGDYDHIAMAYRFNNDVVLLEALGGGFIGGGKTEGIKVFAWQNFLTEKWYEQYSAVVIRRLVGPNKLARQEVVLKLAKFLKTVIHDQSPKYSWHPMKVLSTRPSLPPNDPKRTYFCSELIAKAYKEAGLLRAGVPTASYYPSYFQSKKDLKLLRGFELSPDIAIDFGSISEHLAHRAVGAGKC